MSTINRISGLATGIDVDSWVTDLMRAHREPLNKIKQTKQIWQWKQEDYRSINTSLLALRNLASDMRLQGTYLGKKVSSSNESVVTATAGTNSTASTYQVKVERLASVATNASTGAIAGTTINPSATLVSQQANFTNNQDADFGWDPATYEFSFTINGQTFNFDGDTDSLNSIMNEVNANKEAGVTMFFDSSTKRISITTNKTGDNNTDGQEIQFSGNFLTNVLQLDMSNEQGGVDASFEINGLSGITSHSNSYTANGVTFTFKGITAGGFSGTAANVAVNNDIDGVVEKIKNFVDKYNEIVSTINGKLSEERYKDYSPLTEEQISSGELTDKQMDQWEAKARSGLLKGDIILNGVVYSMRTAMSSRVQNLTGQVTVSNGSSLITTIADQLNVIGITTKEPYQIDGKAQIDDDMLSGKLYVSESQLRQALESNIDAVMDVFTKVSDVDSEKGIAVRLYESVNKAMSQITAQAGSAGALVDSSNIGETIDGIDDRIAAMEDRLEEMEDRYYRQFTAMETAINRMNQQSAWLTQQFSFGNQG